MLQLSFPVTLAVDEGYTQSWNTLTLSQFVLQKILASRGYYLAPFNLNLILTAILLIMGIRSGKREYTQDFLSFLSFLLILNGQLIFSQFPLCTLAFIPTSCIFFSVSYVRYVKKGRREKDRHNLLLDIVAIPDQQRRACKIKGATDLSPKNHKRAGWKIRIFAQSEPPVAHQNHPVLPLSSSHHHISFKKKRKRKE